MAKIDKEALKKNQFWIGLGVFVLLWLIGIIVVKAGSDDKAKKDYEGAKQQIESAKKAGPKTEAYQTPWKQHGAIFRKHKDTIWQQAWQQQADMYGWPADMKVQPLYPQDPFGPDPGTDVNNRGTFRTDYKEQFAGWQDYVYPAEFSGGFEAVFPMQKWHPQRPPTREEIWLAQEDFWVRKEMLIIIKTALDATAWFTEVKIDPKEKLPEGMLGRRVFRNANWELNLLFVKAEKGNGWDISEESTIKNINVSRKTQALANPATNKGLPFVLIKGSASYVMRITGEPLAFEQKAALKHRYSVQTVRLDQNGPDHPPLDVEQKLDWDISPIRRIDKLELGAHSHRTVNLGLQAWDELKKLDPDTTEAEGDAKDAKGATGGTGKTGSTPPNAMGKGSMMTPPGAGSGGTGGSGGRGESEKKADDTRVTGIPRGRYLQVTPQCRHLPIAMRLIVDQAHIHDVLAAVANSRLRIQITQVSILHVNDVKRGEAAPASSSTSPGPGTGSGPRPGRPGGSSMGSSRPPMGLMSPGGRGSGGAGAASGMGGRGSGGGRPGGSAFMANRPTGALMDDRGPVKPPTTGTGGASGTATTTDKPQMKDTARLVELTIYGIATLYDRYPPRPQPAATPGTTTPAPSK